MITATLTDNCIQFPASTCGPLGLSCYLLRGLHPGQVYRNGSIHRSSAENGLSTHLFISGCACLLSVYYSPIPPWIHQPLMFLLEISVPYRSSYRALLLAALTFKGCEFANSYELVSEWERGHASISLTRMRQKDAADRSAQQDVSYLSLNLDHFEVTPAGFLGNVQ